MTLPEQPPHEVEFRVRYAETDQMGIVWHGSYVAWCEVGRTELMRDRGMSYAELERRGTALAVSDLAIRFHASARYDEMVRVTTRVASVRSRAVSFDYEITSVATGQRLATASTTLIAIDRSGRTMTIPAEVRALLAGAS